MVDTLGRPIQVDIPRAPININSRMPCKIDSMYLFRLNNRDLLSHIQ